MVGSRIRIPDFLLIRILLNAIAGSGLLPMSLWLISSSRWLIVMDVTVHILPMRLWLISSSRWLNDMDVTVHILPMRLWLISSCRGLNVSGQLSQRSPTPSLLVLSRQYFREIYQKEYQLLAKQFRPAWNQIYCAATEI